MKVTKQMRTETAHRLAGHPGRCKFIHGHSYLWEVTLEGMTSDNGMLVDFGQLKAVMTEVIDKFDHALVLKENDSIIPGLMMAGVNERLLLMSYRPTAENMAYDVAREIAKRFNLKFGVSVRLWETATSYVEADYTYVKGECDGDCENCDADQDQDEKDKAEHLQGLLDALSAVLKAKHGK